MSILSYPDRGPWGNAKWRGNFSGHLVVDLVKMIKPKLVVDAMCGSGTTLDVCKELKIEAVGLDLHSGFNILRDSILERVGREADFVLTHPPYGSMIKYSQSVWGTEAHPDDLSNCIDDEDFHQKLQIAMLNQREATKNGGVYATVIGDYRRNGVYTSYQAECIARLPKNELKSVLIKQQHNVMSSSKSYGGMKYPFLTHEYVLLFEKKGGTRFHLLSTLAKEQGARLRGTWRSVIRLTMIALGGKADLTTLYGSIAANCPEHVKNNDNWKAKVRQVLNSTGDYQPVERGIWAIA